ncbi:MAG: uracil-xanthine permease family protein [bacterium]
MNKEKSELGRNVALSIQHVFAMFGATVLVPYLTGLDPSVALFTAGAGTLFFHFVTGRKMPVFLGSSFAFIVGIQIVRDNFGLAYATGSLIAVGAVYGVMALIVRLAGVERVQKFFPPIVTGPIIITIGLILTPVAIDMASSNWPVAIITMIAVVLTSILGRGLAKLVPILVGIGAGYAASLAFGIVDFTPVREASWLAAPAFMAPKFSLEAIKIMAPIAIVTIIEHIGDITTNGAVVGKNFLVDPGLSRTLIGDGVATALAGLLGGPANTTYSENTGVLAITKVYNPAILRGAAAVAIALSLVGKLGAFIQTVPTAVMGGVSFILFGMIASIGVKTLVESQPDLTNIRNSSVVFVILLLGIASLQGEANKAVIQLSKYASLSGLSLAAIAGIILNAVFEYVAPAAGKIKAARREETAEA